MMLTFPNCRNIDEEDEDIWSSEAVEKTPTGTVWPFVGRNRGTTIDKRSAFDISP